MAHVTVLGAGVIGLQCALSLLEAGYKVTIIAAHLPGDLSSEYTSPWAGGHWRTHASNTDHEQQAWDLETYAHWHSLLATEPDPKVHGLKSYDSLNYFADPPREFPWYAAQVHSHTPLPPSAFPHQAVAAATSFRSIAVNPPIYLAYLLSRITSLGGTAIRRRLAPPPECFAALLKGVVVNCLALGNESDKAMVPIKGQTVLVRGEADAIRTYVSAGAIAYVIPRPGSGTTVLGGTKDEGNADPVVDQGVTRVILENCKALAPELLRPDGEFDVVRAQVGFRPGRRGGARMEREVIAGTRVVHAYGHAGAGFQNSIGVARRVVKMVGEWEGAKL